MGFILFNLLLNDIVLFIKTSPIKNYTDGNTLKYFAKKPYEVISHLSEQYEVCLDWVSRNGMQTSPTKVQLMMNDCRRTRLKPESSLTLQNMTLENEEKTLSNY